MRTREESARLVALAKPECRVHGIQRCTICLSQEDALLRDYALDVPTITDPQTIDGPEAPPYDTPLPDGHPLLVWRKCEFCAPGRVHPEARGWRCDRCYGFWTGATS